MIAALDRKLLRDARRLGGQVITIALVVASGIASYVTLQGNYRSICDSRDTYYDRYAFGDVFVQLKRAPLAVADRIEAIEGVSRVYPRVTHAVSVLLADEPEPIAGAVVSMPSDWSRAPMNALALRRGRRPEPGRSTEVLLLDGFAKAWGIDPGDEVPVVLGGVRRDLRVVGTALSPEYVMALEPGGAIPRPDRYAVIWMARNAVAPSFQMEGAFNDVVLDLQPGASEAAVIATLDRILEPYGSLGAKGRDKQPSNYILDGEITGLEQQATVVPAIFLGVAAFLLNVVLSRLIYLQRPQIAALKALGYTNRAVGLHYLKLVVFVVMLGSVLGTAVGFWLGRELTEIYTEWFHFPVLTYRLDVRTALIGVGVSLLAAVGGAMASVRQVVRLPPAEAMRPPAPALYRRTLADRLGLMRVFGQSARMIAREIARRPLRTLLSSVGIAMSVAIMVAGRSGIDAFEHLMDTVFQTMMTEDISVTFASPMPERVVRELGGLPGVHRAEGLRSVPVRFRAGAVQREAILQGMTDDLSMLRLMDAHGLDREVPEDGVLMTRKLADILGAEVGQEVEIDVLEGQRGTYPVVISGLIDEVYGLSGYMARDRVHRLLREDRMVSLVLLDVDPAALDDVRERLRERPEVLGVTRRMATIEGFRELTGTTWQAMTVILTLFAATIAVGVVYNNARVSLSMRSRDLASLRVLGFTRAEISAVLLGELAVQVLIAIPIGLWIGTLLAEAILGAVDQERYRMQAAISSQTYAYAALVTLAAGLVSALLVRRKLDRLDLIAVLKTRE
ncbi:MAG: ABC transporter permease [Sandaracinaceae bacterium]